MPTTPLLACAIPALHVPRLHQDRGIWPSRSSRWSRRVIEGCTTVCAVAPANGRTPRPGLAIVFVHTVPSPGPVLGCRYARPFDGLGVSPAASARSGVAAVGPEARGHWGANSRAPAA